DRFAAAEAKDTGKPVTLARTVDIPRAVANFRFFAAAIQHFASECHPTSAEVLNYTLRQSLGVVGCISPWNLPLYLFTWKIAPALAAGNCVVAKPSEITPATATMFAELCGEGVFVQDALYDRFKAEFVARARKLAVGDPADPKTEQGALISEAHLAKVRGYLDLARKEGGTVLCGGETVSPPGRCAKGWFL